MSREDLPYDFEDFGMSTDELKTKYEANDDEHPHYTRQLWRQLNGDAGTQEEYWAWVKRNITSDDDAILGNDAQGNPVESELVAMENLDQFVATLTAWHTMRVKELRHFQQVPEGMGLEISDLTTGQAVQHILSGEKREGFLIGLELALMRLGSLPFVAELEDAPITPASNAANDPAPGQDPVG
jgi:hypothetical protein